jgi:hypothetical protein
MTMRKLLAAVKNWPLVIGLVVALSALTGAGAVFAAGQPSSGSTSEPESQAPPPLTGYQSSNGPVLADEQIAQIARKVASEAGEENPSMTAVNTTLKSAVETDEGAKALDATPAMAELERSEVVLVVLRGHFRLTSASVPRGQTTPTGEVLTLAIDAHTGWVDTRELSEEPAPGISALGSPRTLQ